MFIKSSFKFLLPLIFIPLVLVIIWFRGGLILGGGEGGIPFYKPSKTLEIVSSVWVEYGTGGFTIGWLPKAPIIYFASFFEKLAVPPFVVQFIIIYFLMVTGVISFYYLTLNLLNQYQYKNLVAFIAAVFYLFNPFSMSQVWGRGIDAQFFAFALLPLTLLLFHLGLNKKNYLFAPLIALISGLFATAYGFLTFIIVYWLVIFLYFLYKASFWGIKFILLTFILWCLVNAWWFIPLFSSYSGAYAAGISGLQENLGTLLGVSRNFTPDIIIRLLQRTYFYDASAFSPVFVSLPFQLISWLPFVFVLLGLYKIFKGKLKQFHFFVVLLVSGLIVSLGANPPLGWLFVEIFKKVTILQAFRNPFEKFGLVYALGYSAVFAYGLVLFFKNPFFEGKKIKLFGLGLVLLLTCGIFAWPMWTGRVVAGPDKKIGIDVPAYYQDLSRWLDVSGGNFRVFMTPLWGGDGAFYQWGRGGRYQGSDPMIYLLAQPTISNTQQAPFYFEFMTSIRKYIERMNLAPSLALLRAKYLVNRKDAIFITDRERDHYNFLTSVIYPPLGLENNLAKNEDGDLGNIRYLHLRVKTEAPATLELALRDAREVRIRWDGRMDQEYQTKTAEFEDFIIPLSAPTEPNSSIDFSRVTLIEVMAHPKDLPQFSMDKIEVSDIKLDPGRQTPINEFKKVEEFGNLVVYEPVNFTLPPEFGVLSQVEQVENFIELFDQANKKRNMIDTLGFVLAYQNTGKDFSKVLENSTFKVLDEQKISNTRYWINIEGENGHGLVLLSKTFDTNWKLWPAITREKLTGGFFDDLNLLKTAASPEEDHLVVNGYANMWKVNGGGEYAIVFLPQVIAGIASKISIFSVILLVGVLSIWLTKKYSFSH